MGDIRQQDKAEYRRLLDDIGSDYCKGGGYCIFKEFLVASHPSRRLLIQLKCCDQIKWIKSQEKGEDVGWEETLKLWVDDGYSAIFADVYDDKKSQKEIFKMVVAEFVKKTNSGLLTC